MKLWNHQLHSTNSSQACKQSQSNSYQNSYISQGQKSNPQKILGQKTGLSYGDKKFSRNLTTRNKVGSSSFKQKDSYNFRSSAFLFHQTSQKTMNSKKMNAQIAQNPIDKKTGFHINRTNTTPSNVLYSSWVRSNNEQAFVTNKNSSQISQIEKQISKNRTLKVTKSDIHGCIESSQKQKQSENKKLKKQSIRRLESKVNQYLELIENIKQRATQDPKTWKKVCTKHSQNSQAKQSNYNKQLVKSSYMKQQLKTEAQTPISSPLLAHHKPNSQQYQHIGTQLNTDKTVSQEFQKQWSLKDFIILKKIGQGRLGQIMAVLNKNTNSVYALKKIKKQIIRQNKLQEQILKEIKVQATFNHPNIVKIYGFFDDEECVYLLMEYCEQGSLDEKMARRNYHKKGVQLFNENQTSKCLKDIICGLEQMHQKQIMHRDIKPANIVLSYGVHKICDFGWATPNPDKGRRTTYCGTFDYAPPQIFKGQTYDLQVDLWQLGVMAYQIATGKLPFYKPSQKQTLKNVINYSNQLSFPKQPQLSHEIKQFILDLLQKNPADRIPAKLLLRHPFIVSIERSQLQQ